MIEIRHHFIDGARVPAESSDLLDVRCSHTEEVFARAPSGTVAEAERAVAAAARAFEAWASTPARDRAAKVAAIGAALERRADTIAENIAREVGMPAKLARMIQAGLPIRTFGVASSYADALEESESVGNATVVREPIGVVGCITPWNYPLHQIAAKVAPALVAGNTVVLKPSEIAPTSADALIDAVVEVGLPPGVFNVVFGTGPVVGEVLASHPLVDMVSFTGSTRAGRRVSELAAASVKRVALELGGKSAAVVLDDADLPAAVRAVCANATLNSGQTCSALTRLVVPRAKMDEAAKVAAETFETFTVGDPFAATTRLGPLSSEAQRERVRAYIRVGMEEGARLVTGGPEAPAGLERGYYVKPTVFADVRPGMRIEQEEIFGPVLCLVPHDGEDDAVRIANGTAYGLKAAVYSSDPERAKRVARRLRAGQVDLNEGGFQPDAPFGGFKQSGNGREYGRHGLYEFTELKALLAKA